MARNGLKRIVVLTMLLLMSACGIDRGGIDVIDPVIPSPVPTSMAGSVSGVITSIDAAASTITINQKVLDLSSSVILLNGEDRPLSSISEGQFATTFSDVLILSPQEVRIDLNIAGGEINFDPDSTTFELLGQTVDMSNLASNMNVPALPQPGVQSLAVSGLVTSGGIVDATSVTPYDSTLPAIVTAFTSQVDSVNYTFEFGSQLYDYSQVVSALTANGMVNENDRIRTVLSSTQASSSIVLESIVAAPLIDSRLVAGDMVVLTGYVSEPIFNGQLEVSFIPMLTNSDTNFTNLAASELTLDRLVTVEGLLQADGSVLLQIVSLAN